jgi:hypothetical protein
VLFLSDMTNASTYVRLLRHLGIALVFAPEPFTTPFGVACILAARHLSKRNEASVNSRLRETVKYYLAHSGHFDLDINGAPSPQGPVRRHGLSDEYPIPGQITGSLSSANNTTPSVQQSERDIRGGTIHHAKDVQSLSQRHKAGSIFSDTSAVTQRAIHHTINMEWLSQRYEGSDNAMAHSSWATTSGALEGVMRHSINAQLLSQRYKTGSVGHAKAKSCTINTVQLQQRYGSAVNCATALNALQNNNHYYDTLSRRNVIGGY